MRKSRGSYGISGKIPHSPNLYQGDKVNNLSSGQKWVVIAIIYGGIIGLSSVLQLGQNVTTVIAMVGGIAIAIYAVTQSGNKGSDKG